MRKGDEDWVKKCMEYRVECRRPVRRPRKTWLESVEADMAELEIDKEYVHDRRNVIVMMRKSNPIKAPNDTVSKRWSCHSGLKLLCKLCRTSSPPAMGARFTVFGHADALDGWCCCSQKRDL